jgi:hypothetical protein
MKIILQEQFMPQMEKNGPEYVDIILGDYSNWLRKKEMKTKKEEGNVSEDMRYRQGERNIILSEDHLKA